MSPFVRLPRVPPLARCTPRWLRDVRGLPCTEGSGWGSNSYFIFFLAKQVNGERLC